MIRNAELKDYEQIKALVYEVHKLHLENRPDIYVDGNPLPIEYFKDIIDSENSFCYVYEEKGDIKGVITISKKKNNNIPIAKERTTFFIEDIVVASDCRRKGIGKKLYNYIQNKAIEENIDAIELNVWAFNQNAIKFYESLGMTIKNMKFEKNIK